jgi:hypothetical protein
MIVPYLLAGAVMIEDKSAPGEGIGVGTFALPDAISALFNMFCNLALFAATFSGLSRTCGKYDLRYPSSWA